MALHDYEILNGSGLDVRTDLNAVLSAILSQNSSNTEPTTTVSGMFWYDTTTGIFKQRNVNNDGWVEKWVVSGGRLATLNAPTFTGTVTLPTSTNLNGKTIATLDSPSFFGSATAENLSASGNVSLPATTSIGAISQTELGYLDGVSSNIQNQLLSKLTNTNYATSSVGGVIKVGERLSISSGVLSADNQSISDADILAAIAGATAGGVGTYCFAFENGSDKPSRVLGDTLSGSSLRPSSILFRDSSLYGDYNNVSLLYSNGTNTPVLSGTWRLCGAYATNSVINDYPIALWLRIS